MPITVTFLPESELRLPLVRQILRAKRSVDADSQSPNDVLLLEDPLHRRQPRQ